MRKDAVKYPECERLKAVSGESQAIGNFIEWLGEERMFIVKYEKVEGYRDEQALPVTKSIEQMLADYFDIDLKKVEKERRAILAYLQKQQEAT
jgi:hypothetical protein